MFVNPILAALVDHKYKIDTPVFLFSMLGFLGTFMIFFSMCLMWNGDKYAHDIFSRMYRNIKRDLDD